MCHVPQSLRTFNRHVVRGSSLLYYRRNRAAISLLYYRRNRAASSLLYYDGSLLYDHPPLAASVPKLSAGWTVWKLPTTNKHPQQTNTRNTQTNKQTNKRPQQTKSHNKQTNKLQVSQLFETHFETQLLPTLCFLESKNLCRPLLKVDCERRRRG